MRVFYPISARISDLVNDQATVKSGIAPVWSMLTIAVIAIVSLSLSSFEGGSAERQHEVFTQNHYQHVADSLAAHNPLHNTQS
jgi:hypothetical protein